MDFPQEVAGGGAAHLSAQPARTMGLLQPPTLPPRDGNTRFKQVS